MIKEYRRQYNYSQRDLAELLNVSAKSVGRWEQNKTKPSVDELKLLADIFGISEAELLKKIENSNRTFNIQKELLKQKKIRTIILLATCLIIILFVFITWIYVLNNGLNKDHIIEGSIITRQQTYYSDDD